MNINLSKLSIGQLVCLAMEVRANLRLRALEQAVDPFVGIKGHEAVKRAIAVAAVQNHSLLIVGPEGIGKTMLVVAAASVGVPATEMQCCPCGKYTDLTRACECTAAALKRHHNKIRAASSQHDMSIEAQPVPKCILLRAVDGLTLEHIERAVEIGRQNIEEVAPDISEDSIPLMRQAITELGVSAKTAATITSIARSVAALDQCQAVAVHHLAEAIQYRRFDR